MKTKFIYQVVGEESGRMMAKTIDIPSAEHIARFFVERHLRIEKIRGGEVVARVENQPIESLLPILTEKAWHTLGTPHGRQG